jgi:hypothetical protein
LGVATRRFKTDDRDCAAVIYLPRQGEGRLPDQAVAALTAAGRHRRGLVAQRKMLQQRMHDQQRALLVGALAPPAGTSLPPARAGRSHGARKPAARRRLISLATLRGRPAGADDQRNLRPPASAR